MAGKKHQHLTPEEKRELKKQKKLAAKLRKEETKRQIKRDQLTREVQYGRLTYNKYERDWRQLLIQVALPRMKAELEFAWHNFERTIDCKDFTISLLMDELKRSEDQYMTNFKAHSENMEGLMEIYHDRLTELKDDFDSEVKLMLERYDFEFQVVNESNQDNQEYLKTMLHQLELQRREHIRLQRGEYFSRLDEVEVKNQLLLQKLKATLENRYHNVFDDMKRFMKAHNKRIKERKNQHFILKTQDDSIQELIGQQFEQIKKCQATIRQLRQKYLNLKQTEGNRLEDLQAERKYFSNSFLTLKIKLANDEKDDFSKLMRMGNNCAKVFECLENLNKKGETILTLATVCRKLETLKEKVLPYPLMRNMFKLNTEEHVESTEDIEGVKAEMELFWQRLGQAHGSKFALKREKKFLTQENDLLIDTHNQYCEKLLFPEIVQNKDLVIIPKTDVIDFANKYTKTMHRCYSKMRGNK